MNLSDLEALEKEMKRCAQMVSDKDTALQLIALAKWAVEYAKPALEFYGDTDRWQEPDGYVLYWTLWDDGDNVSYLSAVKALEKFPKEEA